MSWVWAALGNALSKGKGKGYGNQKQGQKFNQKHTKIKPSDLKKAILELQKAPPPPPQTVAWKCTHCGTEHHNSNKVTCRKCRRSKEDPKGPTPGAATSTAGGATGGDPIPMPSPLVLNSVLKNTN